MSPSPSLSNISDAERKEVSSPKIDKPCRYCGKQERATTNAMMSPLRKIRRSFSVSYPFVLWVLSSNDVVVETQTPFLWTIMCIEAGNLQLAFYALAASPA